MDSAITLRLVEPGDEELLYRVYASTREAELAQVDWNAAQKEVFLRMQFTAQHQYYQEHYIGAAFQVILADGHPAGRLYVARWPDEIRIVDLPCSRRIATPGSGLRCSRTSAIRSSPTVRPDERHGAR